MKALGPIVAGFAALVLLLLSASAQVPQLMPFSADMSFSSAGRNGGPARDMDGKIYVSQEALRSDMQAGPRGESIFIVNFPTKTSYVVMPQQRMYIERKASDPAPGMGRTPLADLKPVDPNNPCSAREGVTCKQIGTEVINGRSCDHWEITDKNGTAGMYGSTRSCTFPSKPSLREPLSN